jgi:hypothetical protein
MWGEHTILVKFHLQLFSTKDLPNEKTFISIGDHYDFFYCASV